MGVSRLSAILHTAAQRINADTAGRTHSGGEPNPGQAVAATPAELYHSVVATAGGALDSIFNMEPRPSVPKSAATETPTTAAVGPHGGAVPAELSGLFRGAPAPSPHPGPQRSEGGPGMAFIPGWPETPAGPPSVPPGYIAPAVVKADVTNAAAGLSQNATHALSTLRRWLGV